MLTRHAEAVLSTAFVDVLLRAVASPGDARMSVPDMGDYVDFNMAMSATGAGNCPDINISPSWSTSRFAKQIVPACGMVGARFAVIEDPAGGIAALYQA